VVHKSNVITELFKMVAIEGCKKATWYKSPTEVVKATFQGKRRKNANRCTLLITYGRPNYQEKKFIKKCKKVGEPFPVKKIQLKWDSSS
jgi:hypothetical protein